jgi:hypothetical protein
MNKYQLYTIGGALLAASSLSSAASAAVGGHFGGAGGSTYSATSLKINNLAFSATAATANGVIFGGNSTGILFANQYDNNLASALKINLTVTGASFINISATSVSYIVTTSSNNATLTLSGAQLNALAQPTVSNLGGTLQIGGVIIASNANITFGNASQSVNGAHIVGIELNGQVFTNGSGLATVGGTVSLAAVVTDNFGVVYTADNMAAGTPVITSASPVSVTVTGGTSLSANANAGTPFASFSGSSPLTLTLATVNVTSAGVLATDLATLVDADGSGAGATAGTGSINVTLAAVGALQDPAVTFLTALNKTGAAVYLNTPAGFSSGTVTFSIVATSVFEGTLTLETLYTGTTAINVAAAGTATVAFTSGGSSVIAPAGASGATAGITRSGLSTQVNYATDQGAGGYVSYLRIHNSSPQAGAAVVVVKKDTTDGSAITTLSTYTTGTIAAGGTVQIAMATIEAGGTPAITPAAANSYTLLITGGFAGYVQHLAVLPTGAVVDLDGFRNGGAAAP